MRYVTRERLHVDRIATAWAIRKFVDPGATFAFVARGRDPKTVDGVAFDMRGAELSHRDGKCTIEVLPAARGLAEPGLPTMAAIIHAADLPHDDAGPPEAAGVRAVFDGIRDAEQSDEERLPQGLAICDALYAYCRGTAA